MTQEIINFVAAEVGVSAKRIAPNTSLVGDLKVAGDDGHELMEKFAARFSVDMTGFDAPNYFGTEGANLFLLLFFLLFPRRQPKLLPLTIDDLVKAAERKTWLHK